MLSVETDSAIVDFDDILGATEVVPDECSQDTPWDNCDGFEHTAKPSRDHCDTKRKSRGCCLDSGNRQHVIIELPEGEDYGVAEYHSERGASRGVCAEMVSIARQKTLDLLTGWYENGWQYWGVKCDFERLGQDFSDSIWGIDDDKYADDLREEIALNVASQLEIAGYTVTGKPVAEKRLTAKRYTVCVIAAGITEGYYPRSLSAQEWREEFKRNLHSQDWK
jgi:hypothetical protein